jgi:hypothetical protein
MRINTGDPGGVVAIDDGKACSEQRNALAVVKRGLVHAFLRALKARALHGADVDGT